MRQINTSKKSLSNKYLAELIKKIRSINELTQESFGQLFQPSVTQPTVARWEKGEQNPDSINLSQIANFLDLTLEELKQLLEDSAVDLTALEIGKKVLKPDKQHLKIFKKGVTAWNSWRKQNRDLLPRLAGIELSNINLDKINLNQVDLRGAKLSKLSSKKASYLWADLRGAKIEQVDLSHSDLSSANISQAEIRLTNFEGSKLVKTNWEKTQLIEVCLNSTNLSQANLRETKLIDSELEEANCIKADLENANISNCSVFGASFLNAKLEGIKLEKIYISAKDEEELPVNNLTLAQTIYLQRYSRSAIKKFVQNFQMEEEIINIGSILGEKYGEYNHIDDSYIYDNKQEVNQNLSLIEVRKEGKHFQIRVFEPDYRESNVVVPGRVKSRKILQIKEGIVESNFETEDVERLREILRVTKKIQEERISQFVPIALKFLELKQSKNFIDREYRIEKTNEELRLFDNSAEPRELMRIKLCEALGEEKWKMTRSSLKNKCIMHFQKLLLEIFM